MAVFAPTTFGFGTCHHGLQYHGAVRSLAQRVCSYIRQEHMLRPGDRLGVALSGGSDSVALLRLLMELRDELGIVLSVVHVNHQIRGAEADADQVFVTELAKAYDLPFHVFSVDTPAYAIERHLNLEAAAREVRYCYFQRLLAGGLDKVATAHTLDDQAETVLLRLARGTGTKGLAGIHPQWLAGGEQWPDSVASNTRAGRGAPARPPEQNSPDVPLPAPELTGAIVRPLLAIRRPELQSYLRALAQPWREDATNLDPRFTRNRVRHRLLPMLESELNPRIRELLAETAAIARAEEEYWTAGVSRALPQVWTAAGKASQAALGIAALCRYPLAMQRRLVRAAAESMGLNLEFQHVEELLALAQAPPAGEKRIVLPGGWRVLRSRGRLEFGSASRQPLPNQDFAYSISLPGEVVVVETGTVFSALMGPISLERAAQAYDPACLPDRLSVRNWRPGDRFWPAHTRAPRKIKELLQERKIPAALRRSWPVITSTVFGREQVIWVRGFAPPQQLLAPPGQSRGVIIEERALQGAPYRAE